MAAGPDDLVIALRNAAQRLTTRQSIRDLDFTLSSIVEAAVDTVPGVDAGGVSLAEDSTITSRAPTHAAISKLDAAQSELGEGPCLQALRDPDADGVVAAQDLAGADAQRWPRFAPRVVEAGFRGMLSTQLLSEGGLRVALNLYAAEPDVFDLEARRTAGLFAVQAGVLLYGSTQVGHLQRAVDHRDVIGQAKGILMERFGVDADGAFQMLVNSSQNTNIKLFDVATWLTGQADERGRTGQTPNS
jgi:hypothetical protein